MCSSPTSSFLKQIYGKGCARTTALQNVQVRKLTWIKYLEDDNTAALYVRNLLRSKSDNYHSPFQIPYLTFEKCFEANEASEDDISVQAGNQEMDLQKDNFRAKYQHFMDTYNGKRQVVQGSRSLDQFYYQALPDMKLRDADQVVTRYLLDKDRGDKTKNGEWWPILSIGQLWLWIIDTSMSHKTSCLD